ncbi:MAG: alpha/beta fold hydrolase [Rhodococcus sp. (in: high G+C Gram-positive bacteria)]|uniref:alpha/beta hydrolase n=1 Tax=unclassified Rhodococcus (in: high G+C Gram-positive bacteria) TaxID=192944 RepID=UPI000AAC2C34|nr:MULTISPECIES: alpha/beta fold hydrolase [unclassified Rhodococcus (in: high G+C Gram-positive bacteria)]RMB77049.1 alpha/beta fold hydrolase [Rhodococcus sp. SBT000017]
MIEERTTFTVDGVEVAAVMTLPEGEQVMPCPAVFTAPGFAGVKEMLIPNYSADLAAGGVASLAFDYPGFGASGGDVRQHIDLPQQLRSFRAALDVLARDPRIDSERIAVWGTSMSGGHAIAVAAEDPRVKAVAAIIPFIHLTPTGNFELAPVIVRDALRRLFRRPGLTIPAAGRPGEVATMNSDGAYEWSLEMARGAENYRNEVTVASLPAMLRWSTRKAAARLTVPVLAILAESDTITPPVRVRKALSRVDGVEYVSYPESHFELFTDHAEAVRKSTVKWLVSKLGE